MSRQMLGELISEALAIFIIIAFGDSAAGMYVLYDPSPYKQAYWGVCIAWGLAVTLAIYVTGAVSGTHANPAVTLALAVFRGFSWKKVIPYCAAQVVGAFLGAAVVYVLFGPVIHGVPPQVLRVGSLRMTGRHRDEQGGDVPASRGKHAVDFV